jgi:CRP-like cAMP-binding protein
MENTTSVENIGRVKPHGQSYGKLLFNVAYCLRHLNDRIMLNRSQLAKLTYVRKLAKEYYLEHVLPRGLALHELLGYCIKKLTEELGSDPVLDRHCKYLSLVQKGLSQKQISKELGLSREHVSRVYRPKAIELLAEELLHVIKAGHFSS